MESHGCHHRGLQIIDGSSPLVHRRRSATLAAFLGDAPSGYHRRVYGQLNLVASRPGATSTADVRYRFAINRTLATFAEYVYYYYDFDRSLQLPTGVTPRQQRSSIRIGLTVWAQPWSRR